MTPLKQFTKEILRKSTLARWEAAVVIHTMSGRINVQQYQKIFKLIIKSIKTSEMEYDQSIIEYGEIQDDKIKDLSLINELSDFWVLFQNHLINPIRISATHHRSSQILMAKLIPMIFVYIYLEQFLHSITLKHPPKYRISAEALQLAAKNKSTMTDRLFYGGPAKSRSQVIQFLRRIRKIVAITEHPISRYIES